MRNLIEAYIWKDWVLQCVVTKFGRLKINSGRDTTMISDAKYHHTTYNTLVKLFLVHISVKHITPSAALSTLSQPNFVTSCLEITSFHASTSYYISHLIWQCYGYLMSNFYMMLTMKCTNSASDHMMIMILSHFTGNMFEVNIWKVLLFRRSSIDPLI